MHIDREYSSVRRTGWTLDPGSRSNMACSSSRVCLSAQMPARRDGAGVQRLRLGDTDTRVSSLELELERTSIQPPGARLGERQEGDEPRIAVKVQVEVEVEVEVQVGARAYPETAKFVSVNARLKHTARAAGKLTEAGMESGVNGTHETETPHGCIIISSPADSDSQSYANLRLSWDPDCMPLGRLRKFKSEQAGGVRPS
ncbi:hypothetical protein C8F04DRAFT_1273402 [Mycena alexandri]|uniref:Uncharacterized protein n=1 Tax=Mycena alexandri TaxID=1745969 RepID=A0AAD6WP00_9AGAR|nr:hypothetical protein C8F04DRAFT_1273402 [Mycena alexandri]